MGKFTSEDIRLAQETEQKYGVPASVTLAQYALESGYGTSTLANRANNYFGISGKNKNTGQYIALGGRNWAKYSSKQESFYDHGRLLSTPLYANKTAGAANVNQYIDAIAETYAPSSDGNNDYAGKLKQIIAQNNLTQYDNGGAGGATVSASTMTVGASGTASTTQANAFSNESSTLAKVVKALALVIVVVFAAVFFFNAFSMNLSAESIVKSAVKKAVE